MNAPAAGSLVVLTPPGRAAVATVLVEGAAAESAVLEHFHPASGRRSLPIGRILYGRWGGAEGEELVVCRRAEERVEVNCHGGAGAVEAIVSDLRASGLEPLSWQEWTRRRAGDPFAAEARIALAQATTARTAAILLDQLQGALRRSWQRIDDALAAGRRDEALAEIDALLARADLGLHLTRPWKIVLAGRANVGKSSLINALVGYERAIVFDQPGTTRDAVSAGTAIDGWPVELTDTAGLRDSPDALESAGVLRARRRLAEADLAVLVFDAAQPWTAHEDRLLADWPRAILVHSKADLAPPAGRPEGIATSVTDGAGIEELLAAVSRHLVPQPPPEGDPVPFTQAQIGALAAARDEIWRGDLEAARRKLGSV